MSRPDPAPERRWGSLSAAGERLAQPEEFLVLEEWRPNLAARPRTVQLALDVPLPGQLGAA